MQDFKRVKVALSPSVLLLAASLCGALWATQPQGSSLGKENAALAASDNVGTNSKSEVAGAAAKSRAANPSVEVPASYIIGPEDSLQVAVWHEAELSLSVVVRPDGMISMPLLNDVKAVGLKPLELQRMITEKLKPFVNDPQVTIIVTGIHSRSVYLMGQVGRQGTYQLNGQKTALQLIADSGGLSLFAKSDSIYIMRRVNGQLARIPFKYKKALKDPKFDVELQPGDEVVVP